MSIVFPSIFSIFQLNPLGRERIFHRQPPGVLMRIAAQAKSS
jgi:hypothetical protein